VIIVNFMILFGEMQHCLKFITCQMLIGREMKVVACCMLLPVSRTEPGGAQCSGASGETSVAQPGKLHIFFKVSREQN